MMMTKKTLAVIGGGAAGHQIAHDLKETMAVTLIDPKTYWEVPMALPRLLVDPDALPARMSFDSFLPGVRHVQGRAVGIAEHSVEVETASGRESITFDYALISTGSRYLDPLIKAEATSDAGRDAEIRDAHERLKAARAIVVVGGGPVGVEVAAELLESFSGQSVTLVHGAPKLLENGPSKFAAWARTSLEKAGATLVLGDMVVEPRIGEQPAGGQVKLKSGRILQADAVVWAAGTAPMTEFVKSSWPELVQANGLIKTDAHLRLEGHANIFVAGDVTNLPEGRLVITASFHVTSIVANLKKLAAVSSANEAELKPYKPAIPGKGMGKIMIVTLGRRDGLSSLPFGQIRAAFVARAMKAQNMFVSKYRQAVGLAA